MAIKGTRSLAQLSKANSRLCVWRDPDGTLWAEGHVVPKATQCGYCPQPVGVIDRPMTARQIADWARGCLA